jgi:hypothetical protein
MLYVLWVRCQWRDMDGRYGKWNSVYVPPLGRTGNVGCAPGNPGRGPADNRQPVIDRTTIRATRRQLALRGAHTEGFGRSRGRITPKIRAHAEGQGRPLGFVLTRGDRPSFIGLLCLAAAACDLQGMQPANFVVDVFFGHGALSDDAIVWLIVAGSLIANWSGVYADNKLGGSGRPGGLTLSFELGSTKPKTRSRIQ